MFTLFLKAYTQPTLGMVLVLSNVDGREEGLGSEGTSRFWDKGPTSDFKALFWCVLSIQLLSKIAVAADVSWQATTL